MTPKNILQVNIQFPDDPITIEIQNFEPPKNDPSLHMYENIRVPPSPWGLALLSPGSLNRL